MVSREVCKNDPILKQNAIITNPQGTVFGFRMMNLQGFMNYGTVQISLERLLGINQPQMWT